MLKTQPLLSTFCLDLAVSVGANRRGGVVQQNINKY